VRGIKTLKVYYWTTARLRKLLPGVFSKARQEHFAKAVTRQLPPVTRPGTSIRSGRSDSNASQIAALTKQLETATGNKALKIGAQLMAARRNTNG
jgi:hypothetical protein